MIQEQRINPKDGPKPGEGVFLDNIDASEMDQHPGQGRGGMGCDFLPESVICTDGVPFEKDRMVAWKRMRNPRRKKGESEIQAHNVEEEEEG